MNPNCGGIVLCGGQSSRMGLPKATLPFGSERMLERVIRILAEVVDPIVVVAAPGQELPAIPPDVQVARDRREGRGPLEGLAAGLAALAGRAKRAYVTSCDVPLLEPEFVRRMIELSAGREIAVPKTDGYHHPLAAVYRTSVLPRVEALLEADRLRPFFLFEQADTREVSAAELREADPGLDSLRNLNHPEDYLAALAAAGFVAPDEILQQLQGRRSEQTD